MCSLHQEAITLSPGMRMMAARVLPNMPLPHQLMVSVLFMQWIWMGMETWMCSQHLSMMGNFLLPGMRMTAAETLQPMASLLQQMVPFLSMQRMWMVMGIWMCSLQARMMEESPGIKMTVARALQSML